MSEPTDARPFYVEHRTSSDKPWLPFSTYAQRGNADRRAEAFDMLGEQVRILHKCPTCNTTHEVNSCLI